MSAARTTTDGYPASLCTTFRLLRTAGACTSGYKKLAKHIRDQHAATPEVFGMDRPIPIAVILASNGQADALWSLRATIEPSDQFTRMLACDFAEHVLPIFEAKRPDDKRPREAINMARMFARGEVGKDDMARAAYAYASAYAYAASASASAYASAYASASASASAYASASASASAASASAYASAASAARSAEKQWQFERFSAVLQAARCGDTSTGSKGVAMECAA